MLNKLKQTKTQLMKDRRDTNDTLKHQLTLQINGINTVLTEAKNFAVKHKLPSEDLLTLENQVDVLKAVLKQLEKEIAAYDAEHPKAKDAQFQKEYLAEFIPVEFRTASVEEMDDFIKTAKANNLDFKSIMAEAKQHKNFDMKYISQKSCN